MRIIEGSVLLKQAIRRGFCKAIGYFEDATREDPQYALAYAGLADHCYGIIGATIYGSVPAVEAGQPKSQGRRPRTEIDPDPWLKRKRRSLRRSLTMIDFTAWRKDFSALFTDGSQVSHCFHRI